MAWGTLVPGSTIEPVPSVLEAQSSSRDHQGVLTSPFLLFTSWLLRAIRISAHSVAQSCPTLCNTTDCSPPGSSIHGISQARILEWVAMHSSRGSSQPRDRTPISYIYCIGWWVLYHLAPPGKPPLGSETLRFLSPGMIPSVA